MDIKEIINKRYAMPDASLQKLQQCLTEVSYPKGFQVLKRGKVEKNIFFIKKGIVRAYTPVDGKQITFWFGNHHFSRCNAYLQQNGISPIQW